MEKFTTVLLEALRVDPCQRPTDDFTASLPTRDQISIFLQPTQSIVELLNVAHSELFRFGIVQHAKNHLSPRDDWRDVHEP